MSKFTSTSTGVNANYTSTSTRVSNSFVVSSTPKPSFNFNEEKERLLNDLNNRKGVEVRTSTLFDKYEEITSTYSRDDCQYLTALSNEIWKPTDLGNLEVTISEIESLKPIIIPIPQEDKLGIDLWIHLRRMISTMQYSKGIGRNIKFLVIDEVSRKILGITELSSDFGSLKVRDSFIGWSRENRYKEKMLGHTAVGSTIVPVQPFGFNFLGGKLMSMLLTSQIVRDEWENRYGQKLIGITTTSLYGNKGKLTQYDGMKQWANIGETTGKTFIKPNQVIYDTWKEWIKVQFPKEYEKASNGSAPKQKVLQLIFKKLGLKSKDFHHGYKRGVYFSKFFANSFEFLKNDSKSAGDELFSSSIEELVTEWKALAIERFKEIFKRNKVSETSLFYSTIINQTWEQTLLSYLGIRIETSTPLNSFSVKGCLQVGGFKVFYSNALVNIAKPILIEVKTKVNSIERIYFSLLNSYLLETMYFKSFIR